MTYAEKRNNPQNMMYGPARKVPKYPEFQPGRLHVACSRHPQHKHNRCPYCQEEQDDERAYLDSILS